MGGHYIAKLNNKCNSNCCFCADSIEVRSKKDIGYNQLIRDLEKNREKFDSLIISGGEPTIYKHLFEYLSHAKNICRYKHITLTTNGFLLAYDGFVDRLIKNGVDSFIISFVTSNEKIYDGITKVKSSFGYVTKALSNLRKRKREVRINTVLHKLNYKDIDKTIEFLIKQNVKSIQLSFMNPIGSSIRDGKSVMALTYSEIMPYIKKAFEKAKQLNFDNLFIENFPICTAEEFKSRISDLRKPEENKDYYNACKIKSEKCRKCSYFDVCDGTWEAYLKQFGDKEIIPLSKEVMISKNRGKNHINEDFMIKSRGSNLYYPWYFEWAGLDIRFKKGSIFYLKKKEITEFKKLLKEKGYFFEISEFVHNYKDNFIEKTNKNITDNSLFSVYVSKEKIICKRLKYLDKYHQFNLKEPSGKTTAEVFFEIGKLLGYPKCCNEFVYNFHENQEFKEGPTHYLKGFDEETFFPMAALKKSSYLNYLLNNFKGAGLIGFYVCNYNCKNALQIAKKVLHFLKEKNIDCKPIISNLKIPLVFFSSRKIISFANTRKIDDKIYYSKCILHLGVPENTTEYKQFINEMFSKFLKGDSFIISDYSIEIYKNNELLFTIQKKHRYDGVYVKFD